jgi:exosortase C (VPDSG-CTERM-specific)
MEYDLTTALARFRERGDGEAADKGFPDLHEENNSSPPGSPYLLPSERVLMNCGPPENQTTAASIVDRRVDVWAIWRDLSRPQRFRVGGYAGFLAVLTLLFIWPLTKLMLYAAHSNLHSHILLVPFISAYLLYIERERPSAAYRSSIAGALILGGIGIVALAAGIAWRGGLSVNDGLAIIALAYVSFVAGGSFLFLGSKWMAAKAFPFAFLIFMVPLPDAAVNWLERASMLASAEAAALYFSLVGTPLVRQGTVFELPGIVIRVAQECSGIHSSWVLFIASLLASHIFLRTRWRRIVLVAFVIPLGILRNGFRIMVIGLLCVYIGPRMIDSPIHHRGGPLFFALSLVPLFLLVWWLRRQEQRMNLPG